MEPDPSAAAALYWPWLAGACIALLGSVAVAVWLAYARLGRLARRTESLERLDDLKLALDRLAASHGDLELRRLEHVLIDIRDGQRRVEDRLLAVVEGARAARASAGGLEVVPGDGPAALADRVVTRLLALGYERVQLVTPVGALEALVAGDGEVAIEARRDGSPCKGKVSVRRGVIVDVQMQAAYSVFP